MGMQDLHERGHDAVPEDQVDGADLTLGCVMQCRPVLKVAC